MSGLYCSTHGSQSRVSAARVTVCSKFANASASSSRMNTLLVTPKLEHVLPGFVERDQYVASTWRSPSGACRGTSTVEACANIAHIFVTAVERVPAFTVTVTDPSVSLAVACTP